MFRLAFTTFNSLKIRQCIDTINKFNYTINVRCFQNLLNNKNIRLDPDSLQPRILKYFQETSNRTNTVKQYNLNDYQINKLRTINNNELSFLIQYLPNVQKKSEAEMYLNNLDKECCLRLFRLKIPEIFIYLHDFYDFIPNVITRLKFYTQALNKMNLCVDQCSKVDLLQLCFYAALQKKSKDSCSIIKQCLYKINSIYVNHLNLNDLIIVCNSSYRTSTKIVYQKTIDKIISSFYDNLSILNDTTVFIIFVKSLRQNQCQTEELLNTILNGIFFNRSYQFYNFTACIHLLALYADALFYDENLFKLLINKCIADLQQTKVVNLKEHYSKQIRLKDLSRLLWSISYIQCDDFDENSIREHVVPILETYLKLGDLDKNIEHYIGILLSLWMMEYQLPKNVFSSIITRNTVALVLAKRKQRFVARLNLLLTCIQWENKELFDALQVPVHDSPMLTKMTNQIRSRPHLKKLLNILNAISKNHNMKFEFTMPVPYLNIVGITGFDKNNVAKVYVELIDDAVIVKNTDSKPHGLMNLKLRLLKTLRKPIIEIYEDVIEKLAEEELKKFIERKLKIISVIK